MSLQFFTLCAVLAIASAGYLQPSIRYEHAAPIAIPQPPITYTVPSKSYVEPLAPVITSSYGYKTEHTPVPAPIIRAEPLHVAPAIEAAPIARVGFAAPAIHSGLGYAGGFGFAGRVAPALGYAHGSPLGLARGYATTGYGFGAPAIHAGLGYAGTSFGLARGFGLAAPAQIGFAGVASPLTFGKGYATGFGFGHGSYGTHF